MNQAPVSQHHTVYARSKPLQVAVSGLFLNMPRTGTGRYARSVIERLVTSHDIRTTIVGTQETPAITTARGQRQVIAQEPPFNLGNYGAKLYWEQIGLRLATMRLRADVLYSPHFSLPLFPPCRSVISVHDLIPLTDPAYAGHFAARSYFRLVSATARQANAVVTLSEFTRGEIVRLLGVDPSRVFVVSPGVESVFQPVISSEAQVRARQRYSLPDRYLFYVGGADVRKNIGVLLQAFALALAAELPTLVIAAGLPKPGQEALFPDWRAQAHALNLGARVRFIERITEEDLPAVYQGAIALCFPSRAEGFGLTPLEALACGTPVLTSNTTSLPEAVGAAGILLPPDDAAVWAEAMANICQDAHLRKRLEHDGLVQAARFTWDRTAAQVLDIIRSVA